MDSVRNFWRDLPVSSKLALMASVLVMLVVVALTVVSVQRERSAFRQELAEQAELLLNTLPYTMRDQLYLQELDELQDIAGVVSEAEDVTLFRIYDADGALLIDASREQPVFAQQPDELGAQLVEYGRDELYLEWQADQLLAGRSIWVGAAQEGAVVLGLTTAELNAKISTLSLQSALLAVIALAVGIGLAVIMAQQITTPLAELTTVASEMAGGNLKTRVQRGAHDEIGQLGVAFNQMAESIQTREEKLRDLTARQEAVIEERTQELRNSLQKLVKANAELALARREAEEATRLKSQFLATMSHELRTPLNAIMGFSQLLLAGTSGPLNEKQKEKTERILTNSQTLLEMINDLLDLAKIESGRTELVEKPFVVREWLDGITYQLEGLARAKDLKFIADLDAGMPEIMVGDPVRLKQIAINLLSNGIKFTDDGEVRVRIERHRDTQWRMIVSDTGIGIPSHAQEYIFDEFRQVDGSSRREHGGTGLGLAIVRNLVMMMGGTINVKSKAGEGSTFTVVLPLTVREASETA